MKYQYWKGDANTQMVGNNIFVFGSNAAGIHGAGAALLAMQFGARRGQGRGRSGNTYALVVKNLHAGYVEKSTGIRYDKEGFRSVSPEQISANVEELYEYARVHPELIFHMGWRYHTWPNGAPKASLNGYTGVEMWNMFIASKDVPPNIRFHESFRILENKEY